MRVNWRNIWAGLVIVLLLTAKLEGLGQPSVLFTNLTSTTPSSINNRWTLNSVGGFKQFRFQANQSGNFYWSFHTGTPMAPSYDPCWRPWSSGNNMPYNLYIPTSYDNGARYNTSNGGFDGEIQNIQNNYYYTFNVGSNATANNVMSVLETSFSPVSFISLVDAPAPYGARLATVTISAPLNTDEHIYIRYTTDNYANSTIFEVTNFGTGTIGTALVPVPSTYGVTQQYYAYSSNRTKTEIDLTVIANSTQAVHDMFTLSLTPGISNVFAYPIVVTSSGGTTLMNTYSTLKQAFDAINAGTAHSGVITIAIIGNSIETASAVLNASGTGAPPSSYSSIGIQAAGGFARTISGTIDGGPLVNFSGADWVTIDGLNTGGNSLTISNLSISATAQTSTIKLWADATYNMITNCSILGSATVPLGTNGGNIFFSTGTTTGNDNNTISNCIIGPAGANLPSKGIYGNGSTTNATIANSSVTIQNCEIYDFFLAGGCAGIYALTGNTDWTISNNKIYQTASRAMTSTMTGIYFANAATGNNIQITANTIGYASNAGTGMLTLTGSGTVDAFQGISISAGTTTASSVQGNTIQSISINSTTTGSLFYGIKINGGIVNVGTVTGNVVGHASIANSISIAGTSSAYSVLIDNSSSAPVSSVENNILANVTYSSATGSPNLCGIMLDGYARKNKIYNIGSANAGASPSIFGIYIAGSSIGECSNNFISLSGGNSTNPTIHGIYALTNATPTNYIYYNTVNITGSATVTSSTYCFRRAYNSPFVLKNNILVNNRATGGSGHHVAIYVSPTGSLTSDYNDFYTADPNALAYWPALYRTFSQWKTASGQDSHSVNVAPVFISDTDLHLVTSSNDGLDKQGTPVTVTTDIDGATRDAVTPDIGADEFVSTSCSPTTGGTASGATSFCGSGTPSITCSGYSVITGTTYQWQYSYDNFSSVSDLSGQTDPATLTTGVVSLTTWYRLRVTCPAAFDTTYSTIVAVTIKTVPLAVSVDPSAASVCEDSVVQLDASGGALSSTILEENFNNATNNWGKINNSAGGTPANAAWTLQSDGYIYSTYGTWHSNDNTQFYLSNSDAQGSGGSTATILQTPAFSTVGYSAADLSFYHYFKHGIVSDPATVAISSDGTSWTTLETFTANTGSVASFAQASYSLSALFLNQPVVFVRFTYTAATTQYFWGIDNVTITGTPTANPITWAPQAGLYTNPTATITYTGTNLSTVYAKPASSQIYTATATTTEGCTSSGASTITVYPLPTAVLSGDATICAGASKNLTVAFTGAQPWSFTYTDGVNTVPPILTSSSPVLISVFPSATTVYTLTAVSDANCTGTVSGSATVSVNPLPTATITPPGPTAVCEGDSVVLTASAGAGYSYLWSIGSTAQAVTVTNSGSYVVTVTDANGCTAASAPTVVTVNPNPTAVTIDPGSAIICKDSILRLVADGGLHVFQCGTQAHVNTALDLSTDYPAPYTQFWPGQRMQMIIKASELTAAGFTNGSTFKILEFPVVALGSDWTDNFVTACDSFQVSIGPTALNRLHNFQSGLTRVYGPFDFLPTVGYSNTHIFSPGFLWDGFSNIIIETTFSNFTSGFNSEVYQYYSPSDSLTYICKADGFYASQVAVATLPPKPRMAFQGYDCRPDFKLSGRTGVGTVVWDPIAGLYTDSDATIPYLGTPIDTVYAHPETTTIYTATSTSAAGCTSSGSVTVSVNSPPTAVITPSGPTTFCQGGSVDLTASGGTGYLWSNAATNATITVVSSGIYTVTVTDSNGCSNTADTVVTVNPLPIVAASSPTVCVGNTITLTPATGGVWASSDDAVATVTNGGIVTGVAAGNVTFTFTETDTGCVGVTASIEVLALPATSTIYHN
jgi:hypothetical protein